MSVAEINIVAEKLAGTKVDEDFEVSFAGKGLKMDSEADAQELVAAIKNCDNMTSLKLEGNTIGISAAKAIAKALESKPKFQRALWKDMFTQRTENEIPEALTYLSSGISLAKSKLVELDLSDNAFGPRGIRGIVNLLKSESCYSLKELRLNNNGLGIMGGKMLADCLMDCLASSKRENSPLSLKVFICGRNRLENDGARALSQFLKKIGTLEVISMPQNGICHEGIAALADAFAENPLLKEINLEDNNFTEKGAIAISKCLSSLENLEIINFGDCLVRTEGAVALAEVIKENCRMLRKLHLGFNEIEKKGGIHIAEAMANKPYLETLDMNGNQFGSEGCQMVKTALAILNQAENLMPLSDDDGADDDDDLDFEDEEDEDDDDDYEDYTDDKVNEKQNVSTSDISSSFKEDNKENKEITSSDSLSKVPDVEELNGSPNKLNERLYLNVVKDLGSDPDMEDYVKAFLKIASYVSPDNQGEFASACTYADELLSAAFMKAEKSGSFSLLTNTLLVHFGLIKSEDKKFKPASDLRGPLMILQHVVQQQYFDYSTKDILKLFLSRPVKIIDVHGKLKHSLMQTLFQC